MGYELHIKRIENPKQGEVQQITAEEWLALVASDDELDLNPDNGPHFAEWSGSSTHERPWFDWSEGSIHTKYPDRAMLGKMLQMAAKLDAIAEGDDGELYTSPSDVPTNLTNEPETTGLETSLPEYQRKEIIWTWIIGFIIAIAIIAINLLDLW